jgi:KTSC domain
VKRIELDSTALTWVRYLPEQRILQVSLRTGRDYEYCDVPASIYRELLGAESKGRYYNLHIRNDFPFREIRRNHAG